MEGGDGTKYIKFVKKYHKAHPHLTWKQAMKKASKSYHALKGGAIESTHDIPASVMRQKMLEAAPFQGAGVWPGYIDALPPSTLGGNALKSKKKKLKAGGPLSNLPIVGPLLGIFGLGEPESPAKAKSTLQKKMVKHISMMNDLLGSGLLAGSGYESHAKKHAAAMASLLKQIV